MPGRKSRQQIKKIDKKVNPQKKNKGKKKKNYETSSNAKTKKISSK